MTTQRIPLMFIPLATARELAKRLMGIGGKIAQGIPELEHNLGQTDLDVTAAEYVSIILLNSLVMGLLFFGLMTPLIYLQRGILGLSLALGGVLGGTVFAVFFVPLLNYPIVIAKKKAERIDKDLVYVLKDILLQISSGVSLFESMTNVAKAEYGEVSAEFGKTVQDVNSGFPMTKALERMALRNNSNFMKKTNWQLINTLRAGASVKGALKNIVRDLTADQRMRIRRYAHELNMWTLGYMMIAVAVPTIGTTLLIVLTSFSGMGVGPSTFILLIVLCFIIQVILIGAIKSRRPAVRI